MIAITRIIDVYSWRVSLRQRWPRILRSVVRVKGRTERASRGISNISDHLVAVRKRDLQQQPLRRRRRHLCRRRRSCSHRRRRRPD